MKAASKIAPFVAVLLSMRAAECSIPHAATCTDSLVRPHHLADLTRPHLRGDAWPNPTIHCSARYWSWNAVGRLLGDGLDVDNGAAYRHVLNASGSVARCCRLEVGQERYLIEETWGKSLFKPVRVQLPRGVGEASLSVVPLCPVSVSIEQNPLVWAIHSARWFGRCPGAIQAQYTMKSTRENITKDRVYPFSSVNPFLFQFDWIIGPLGPSRSKFQHLGSVQSPRSVQAALYVQRSVPKLVYVTSGAAFTALFERRVLPLINSPIFHSTVALYFGSGGAEGAHVPPTGDQLVDWATSPHISAIFAEDLNVPVEQRPPNLFGVPSGICARELTSFSASFVETASRAPPFEKRHTAVYGCFSTDADGYSHDRETSWREMRKGVPLFAWCRDSPVRTRGAFFASRSPRGDSLLPWQDEHREVLEDSHLSQGGGSCSSESTSTEDRHLRNLWHNASQFKFAWVPFDKGLECGRMFELLAMGCIVLVPHRPGLEKELAGLPVAFVRQRDIKIGNRMIGADDDVDGGQERLSLETVTALWLSKAEARLGPTANDPDLTRRRLSPGYWAERIKRRVAVAEQRGSY